MKRKTDTPATAGHKSMAALLIRLGADPDEAYNATEGMTSEAKRVALELLEQSKLQILSRIEALHVALKGFKAEVETRFEAVDRRFESIEREVRTGFKAIDQRFDGMERRFDKMEQRFDRMEAQFDGHLTSYRRLLLLLVVPVAVAITAGIGGMIWKAISSSATGLP